jgi:hypothetical protein
LRVVVVIVIEEAPTVRCRDFVDVLCTRDAAIRMPKIEKKLLPANSLFMGGGFLILRKAFIY